jgi:very-short-patch-repair endonuclease
VSREQLLAAGLSHAQIAARVASGWLIRRHSRVFAIGHVPRSRTSRWHAAVLALGATAVLSHRSAAALWGILGGAVPTEITVAPGAGHRRRDGLIVHRSCLTADDITTRDGVRVTSLERTLRDLAAVSELWVVERAFEEAQVQHDLKPDPLAAVVLSHPRARGNAKLRAVLAEAVDPEAVRSILELRFLKLCAAHVIRRPLVNVAVGPWLPDFRWEAEGVIVETDGVRFHRTAATRRRDAEKQAFLEGLGYEVSRVTWAEVAETPALVARRVTEALARRRDEWTLRGGCTG